jgi:putative tryptophan/tyrosine transport system substrate-binding protein
MRRREVIALVATGGALPLGARGQARGAPVIGILSSASAAPFAQLEAAFRQGLQEAGYIESRNIMIEHRWAKGEYGRLPGLAADLVRRRVAVIFAHPIPAALAAKAATSTIPIVFAIGSDPVELELVAGMNRPAGM